MRTFKRALDPNNIPEPNFHHVTLTMRLKRSRQKHMNAPSIPCATPVESGTEHADRIGRFRLTMPTAERLNPEPLYMRAWKRHLKPQFDMTAETARGFNIDGKIDVSAA